MKPALVRYYFDADILGLAKVVAALRSDVTYPGARARAVKNRHRPACVVTSANTADTVWIPQVAAAGMAAITRDSQIERHPAERAAIIDNDARLFALNPVQALTVWAQLELLMCQWRRIERLAQEPGPYMYRVSRTRLHRLF